MMTMFRLLKRKSLQRRAWYMGSFLCRDVDELVYADVRHRLARCGGVETRVKLSSKGWVSGGGRNMPSQFYSLDMIAGVQSDPVFVNVLLCLFRRADAGADFPFEIVAYKFDDDKATDQFRRLFDTLCPSLRMNAGSGLVKKPSVLPVRGTAGKAGGKSGALMPGRPTHGVMGSVAPDRWAAKNRATPRLFVSRSLDNLLDDSAPSSYALRRHLSTDQLDQDLSGSDVDDDQTRTTASSGSLHPAAVVPADVVLEGLNGAWWSEDPVRTKEVGVAAAFPDATDRLRKQRRAGLECWLDGEHAACQAYVLPAKTAPVTRYADDDDDYVNSADEEEFKWVFSSDEDDQQDVFDSSVGAALVRVNCEQASCATSVQQAAERVDPAAAQTDDTAPSDVIKYKYNRRLDQQTTVYSSQPNVSSSNAQIARVVSHKSSSRQQQVPSSYVAPRRPQQQSTKSAVRRARSDASAARVTGDRSTTGVTGAMTAAEAATGRPVKARLTSVREETGRRRRVQSMVEYGAVPYQNDADH